VNPGHCVSVPPSRTATLPINEQDADTVCPPRTRVLVSLPAPLTRLDRWVPRPTASEGCKCRGPTQGSAIGYRRSLSLCQNSSSVNVLPTHGVSQRRCRSTEPGSGQRVARGRPATVTQSRIGFPSDREPNADDSIPCDVGPSDTFVLPMVSSDLAKVARRAMACLLLPNCCRSDRLHRNPSIRIWEGGRQLSLWI